MGLIQDELPAVSETVDLAPKKSFRDSKRWISNLFYQGLNRYVTTSNGDQVTGVQAMVENVINLAVSPEQDPYVNLAASKFIIEHLEGKAGAITEEHHEEMPRLIVNINTAPTVQAVKENVVKFETAEPKEDIVMEISDTEVKDEGN